MITYRDRIEDAPEILNRIKPRLEKLWAQPDAIVPGWATNGIVYNTFPRTEKMDPDGFAHVWPEMQDTMQKINAMIQKYYDMLNLDADKEPYVCQMWVHCHTPGADGLAHNHPEMVMAGGFYLDCDINQGNLLIEDTEYHVQTGDIVFWPGNVFHTVLPNKLDKNRIAAAIMVAARAK